MFLTIHITNNTINSLRIHFHCQIEHSKVIVQQDSS